MHSAVDQKVQISTPSGYVFDNADERAQARFRCLSALYDAQTVRHLKRRGVDRGWTCLEVGGGGGSITSWLCERVGDLGGVLATDIEPRFLHTIPYRNLGVRCHDIRTEGLPQHQFDLAHARLVLMNLPERDLALQRMIESVKPGGWIVLEEFDDLSILPDPSINADEEELQVRRAFRHALTARGAELRYGRLLPQKLRAQGLMNVEAEAGVSIWKGHSSGTRLLKLDCYEMRGAILDSGLISQAEFAAEMERVDERDFLMLSPMMWTVWGQVPEKKMTGAQGRPNGSAKEAILSSAPKARYHRWEDLAGICE